MNIGTLTVSLGVDLTGLDRATKAMNTTAQRFRTFGYLASAALTLPIVLAGKAMFGMAKDFEYSMQKIVGLTGVAQSAVNQWSDEIMEMGPRLGKMPQELAEALYFISSSGIKGAEAMNVLELSAKAAASGLGETKTVADVLTSALNAYAGTGKTAAYYTDVLIAAVRVGKAEASSFATAIGQLIPFAAQAGVSFDQIAGGMAAITLTGSSAASAAVYLKGVLNTLVTANEQGVKALKRVGLTYTDLRKIIATGPEGLINVMQKFRDIQMTLGDEAVKDVLPNIRALTAFMSIAGKNFEYNSKIMKEVTNAAGSLGAAFVAVSDTIKIRYDRAISAANVSMISLGKSIADAFLPILEVLVKKLAELTEWFNSLSEAQKQHKIVFIAVIAALGPATLLISLLMYTLSGLVMVIKLAAGAWIFLNKGVVISTISLSSFTRAAYAASVAAAPFALAIIAIGAATVIAWPVIQNLIDKIKALKKEIAEGQAALDFNDIGMQLTKDIAKNMSVLSKLDNDQLATTKGMISQRIALERDRLINAEATGKKEIEQELEVLKQKKIIFDKAAQWEIIKKQYAEGSIFPQDFKTFGVTISMEIQKANKAINDYVKNRQAEVEYDKSSAETIIEFYIKEGEKIDALIQKHIALGQVVTDSTAALEVYTEQQEKIKGVFASLAEGELHINRMTKLLGNEFDTAKAKTELYNKILSELANTTIPLTDKRMQELVKGVKLMNNTIFAIPKTDIMAALGLTTKLAPPPKMPALDFDLETMETLQEELAQITLKEAWMGDTFDEVSAQASVLEKTIAGLNKVYPEGSPLIDSLIEKYNELMVTQEKLTFSAKRMGNVVANAITNMADVMGRAFVNSEGAALSMAQVILQTGQQVIQMLLAESIATLFLASATIAQKAVARAGLFGLIAAAIGISALLAIIANAQSKIKKTVKMAGGGTVPPGYPNDTYPALLTSKETVLPAGLHNLENINTKPIKVIVEGRLKGKDMYLQQKRFVQELNSNT